MAFECPYERWQADLSQAQFKRERELKDQQERERQRNLKQLADLELRIKSIEERKPNESPR